MRSLRRSSYSGFTLVELLIVIVIMGIITALSVSVFLKQMQKADRASTEALIKMLDTALQDRLESFYAATRGFSASDASQRHNELADGQLTGGPATAETTFDQGKRAAVIARLDAMRGDFPQQFIDFMRADLTALGVLNAADNKDQADSSTDPISTTAVYIGLADPRNARRMRTAIYMEYLKRTVSQQSLARDSANPYQVSDKYPYHPSNSGNPTATPPTGNGLSNGYSPVPLRLETLLDSDPSNDQIVAHDPATESSECLYLLLSAAATEGVENYLEQIDPRFIKDTDHDGLMEFVDAWGTPLRFYRWPTDYLQYLSRIAQVIPPSLLGGNALDRDVLLTKSDWFEHRNGDVADAFQGFDPASDSYLSIFGGYFRLHRLYAPTLVIGANEADESISEIYPLYPIIVSAGPDAATMASQDRWRAFGLAWPQSGDTPEASNLDARCARVAGYTQSTNGGNTASGEFVPDATLLEGVADNIVSILIRAGRDN